MLKNNVKILSLAVSTLFCLALMASSAHALSSGHELASDNYSSVADFTGEAASNPDKWYLQSDFSHRFAQRQNAEWKSRGEVMSEIKRRYEAKILKIRLDQAREVYVVRLLMRNGKVKTVKVSARR